MKIFGEGKPRWIPLVTAVNPYSQPSREGMDPALDEAMGTVQWGDENTVRLSRYLGLDILDRMGEPVSIRRKNVKCETRREGKDTISIWRTPEGTLRQIDRRCRDDGTSYRVEHLVKRPSDLPVLAAIFEDEELTLDPEQAKTIKKRKKLIGDDGILKCSVAGTPLGMMYRQYSGVETLAYLYQDSPQALRDMFTVMERNYQTRLKISIQAAADAYEGMDDTSTTVISPRMFEKYNLELTDQRADICHGAGKLYFHHSCGLIRDLLPLYQQTRMDAVDAFTEPPVGDVTIVEGRRILGDRITIRSSVGVMREVSWNPEMMRTYIHELFSGITAEDRIVMSIGAKPHRTIDQMKTVVDACLRFKR